MEDLEKIIDALNLNDDVDAVFITGSFGAKNAKPYSGIDLVVLLKENKMNLYSLLSMGRRYVCRHLFL